VHHLDFFDFAGFPGFAPHSATLVEAVTEIVVGRCPPEVGNKTQFQKFGISLFIAGHDAGALVESHGEPFSGNRHGSFGFRNADCGEFFYQGFGCFFIIREGELLSGGFPTGFHQAVRLPLLCPEGQEIFRSGLRIKGVFRFYFDDLPRSGIDGSQRP